jgi:hypothetical protein
VLFPALLELSVDEDFVYGVFRAVRRVGSVERVRWILVHVRVPILDLFSSIIPITGR